MAIATVSTNLTAKQIMIGSNLNTSNLQINNVLTPYQTNATASTPFTFTNASSLEQWFTGSTVATAAMPDGSTIPAGVVYLMVNNSTATVAITDSAAGAIVTLAAGQSALLALDTAGTPGTWVYNLTGSGGATTNTLSLSTNTLTSTINGVAATSNAVSAVTITSAVNAMNSHVNGVAAGATAPIINSNALSSAVNTLTSTINGVANTGTGTLVNSNTLAIVSATGVLTSTINGIANSVSCSVQPLIATPTANDFVSVNASGIVVDSGLSLVTTVSGASTNLQVPSAASVYTLVSGLISPITILGNWDASTNTPTLTPGSGTNGTGYYIQPGGTSSGPTGSPVTYIDGDIIYQAGSVWLVLNQGERVVSINGLQGVITNFGTKQLSDFSTTPATDAQIPIYVNGSTEYVPASLSGGATMTNAGVVTLQNYQNDTDWSGTLADNSASTLTFSSVTATYSAVASLVVGTAVFTYPATPGDTNAASITGLPVSATGSYNCIGVNTNGVFMVCQVSGSTITFLDAQNNALLNEDLTGATVTLSFVYSR